MRYKATFFGIDGTLVPVGNYAKLSERVRDALLQAKAKATMMQVCGLKVAMGNAAEGLKAAADYIAPSIDEDGADEVIKKFALDF